MIRVEDFNEFMFSLMCHTGSSYHTQEVNDFIDAHGCDKEVFKKLSEYMNKRSRESNELNHLKSQIRERDIEQIKIEMPNSNVAEWILDNFDRKRPS